MRLDAASFLFTLLIYHCWVIVGVLIKCLVCLIPRSEVGDLREGDSWLLDDSGCGGAGGSGFSFLPGLIHVLLLDGLQEALVIAYHSLWLLFHQLRLLLRNDLRRYIRTDLRPLPITLLSRYVSYVKLSVFEVHRIKVVDIWQLNYLLLLLLLLCGFCVYFF